MKSRTMKWPKDEDGLARTMNHLDRHCEMRLKCRVPRAEGTWKHPSFHSASIDSAIYWQYVAVESEGLVEDAIAAAELPIYSWALKDSLALYAGLKCYHLSTQYPISKATETGI